LAHLYWRSDSNSHNSRHE